MDPSSGPLKNRSYPIKEDMLSQLLTWRAQRTAWIGFAAVCVAAMLGCFGDGYFAQSTISDPSGQLRIEYHRIERRDAVSVMRIRAKDLPAGSEAVLRFGRAFVDKRSLRVLDPVPLRAAGDADQLLHTYAVPPSGVVEVLIEYRPREVGSSSAPIGLVRGAELSVDQVILP